ncbi:hypothetical protein SBV1_1570006 [Verrucomicrobia bacterium]|nr:hypothetical protein SBV1_1570006 [Verrucomicrobiota bacterium]
MWATESMPRFTSWSIPIRLRAACSRACASVCSRAPEYPSKGRRPGLLAGRIAYKGGGAVIVPILMKHCVAPGVCFPIGWEYRLLQGHPEYESLKVGEEIKAPARLLSDCRSGTNTWRRYQYDPLAWSPAH